MEKIKFDKKNYSKHGNDNKRMIRKSLEDCGQGRIERLLLTGMLAVQPLHFCRVLKSVANVRQFFLNYKIKMQILWQRKRITRANRRD